MKLTGTTRAKQNGNDMVTVTEYVACNVCGLKLMLETHNSNI